MALSFRINVISKRLIGLCCPLTHPFLPALPYPKRSLFTNGCNVYFAKKKVDEVKIPKCPDFEQYFTKTKNSDYNQKENGEKLGRKSDDKQKSLQKPATQPPIFGDRPTATTPQPKTIAERKSSSVTTSQKVMADSYFPIKVPNATKSQAPPDKTKPPDKSKPVDKKHSITKSLSEFTQTTFASQQIATTKNRSNGSSSTEQTESNTSSQSTTSDDYIKTKGKSSESKESVTGDIVSKRNLWLGATAAAAAVCTFILATLLMKLPSSNDSEKITPNEEVIKHQENAQPQLLIKYEKDYQLQSVIKTEKDDVHPHPVIEAVKSPYSAIKTEKDDVKSHSAFNTNKIENKTPLSIPNRVPYLIIGGGTASWSAFRAIKERVPNAKVLVISNEQHPPYMRPVLAQSLSSSDPNSLQINQELYFEPADFYTDPMQMLNAANGGVAILSNCRARKLKLRERKVVLTDGTEIEYDECLIAIGSQPQNLHLFQTAPTTVRKKISFFRSLNDFQCIKEMADKSESIAVIGGGFLASQISLALTAYAAHTEKLKVYQIFHENGNMGRTLPRYFSEWIKRKLTKHGLFIIPCTQVDSVQMEKSKLKLGLLNGQLLVVDHVIVALGSRSDSAFAQMSGLKLASQHRGIAVNEHLEALPHLYVAGDAGGHLGKETDTSYDHAIASGRLAGENMVGKKKPYVHQSMFSTVVGPELAFETVGLIDSKLKTIGVFSDGTNFTSDIENTDRGVVFYMESDKVVGILLWNVCNKLDEARQIIADGKKVYDINEVLKRFEIQK